MFVDGPPKDDYRRRWEMQCTTRSVWPVFDGVLAGVELLRTGIAVTAPDAAYQHSALPRPADIGFGLAFMMLFAISSGVGVNRISDCNVALGRNPAPRRHLQKLAPPDNDSWAATPPPRPRPDTAAPAGAPPQPPPPSGAAPTPEPPAAPVRQQIDYE